MVVHDRVMERLLKQMLKQPNRFKAIEYLHRLGLSDKEFLELADTIADYKDVKETTNGPKS